MKKKRYFLDIFKGIDKLLDAGLAMTDLKPENTLFDHNTGRGYLIDFGGIVNKGSLQALEIFRFKYLKEFTEY